MPAEASDLDCIIHSVEGREMLPTTLKEAQMPRLTNLPRAEHFETEEEFFASWEAEYEKDPDLFLDRLEQLVTDTIMLAMIEEAVFS